MLESNIYENCEKCEAPACACFNGLCHCQWCGKTWSIAFRLHKHKVMEIF